MQDRANPMDGFGGQVMGSGAFADAARARGLFTLEHWRKGECLHREGFKNLLVTLGKNQVLDAALAGSGYSVTGPYMGLISAVGFSAIAPGDTMASHPGWTEAGGANAPTYSAPRKTCVWSLASGGSKALSAALSFTFTGGGTIKGGFIVFGAGALSTIDNTAGVLFSAGQITDRAVIATDVLNLNYSVSLVNGETKIGTPRQVEGDVVGIHVVADLSQFTDPRMRVLVVIEASIDGGQSWEAAGGYRSAAASVFHDLNGNRIERDDYETVYLKHLYDAQGKFIGLAPRWTAPLIRTSVTDEGDIPAAYTILSTDVIDPLSVTPRDVPDQHHSIAVGQHALASGGAAATSVATLSSPSTAGSLIVLTGAHYKDAPATFTSFTDNKGNSFSTATVTNYSGGTYLALNQRYNPAIANAGSGHAFTMTVSATGAFPNLAAVEITGHNAASPLDQVLTAADATTLVLGITVGPTATLAQANEFLLGAAFAGSGYANSFSSVSPFTQLDAVGGSPGAGFASVSAYRISASTAAQSFTATMGAQLYNIVACLSAWKEAAGGGGSTYGATINESTSPADGLTSQGVFGAALGESTSPSDTFTQGGLSVTLAENSNPTDGFTALVVRGATLADVLAASDIFLPTGGSILTASLLESAAPSDLYSDADAPVFVAPPEPDPFYDVLTALYLFAPGVLLTREIDDSLHAQYEANGFTPLTQDQVLAITGTPPAYPAGMKRFQDSNPAPRDNWAIDNKP